MMTELLPRVILPMGLAGSLFYLLLQLLRPLFARLKAGWKRAALLACAALFLLPLPLLALALPAGSPPASPGPMYSAGRLLGQAAQAPPAAAPAPAAPAAPATPALPDTSLAPSHPASPRRGITTAQLAAGIYWAGAAAALALYAARHRRLAQRLARAARPESDAEALALYAELCREMGVKKAPALMVCGGIPAPVLAGLRHSRILLPEGGMRPDALRFALRHELCHHQNGDLMLKHLLLLISALHWYSPAAHLLRLSFAGACEQSCDEAVTARLPLPERKHYAAVLLDFAGPAPLGAVFPFAGQGGRLRARLKRLMAPARPRRFLRGLCVLLLCPLLGIALLAGCGLAAGASSAAPGEAPPQAATAQSAADSAVVFAIIIDAAESAPAEDSSPQSGSAEPAKDDSAPQSRVYRQVSLPISTSDAERIREAVAAHIVELQARVDELTAQIEELRTQHEALRDNSAQQNSSSLSGSRTAAEIWQDLTAHEDMRQGLIAEIEELRTQYETLYGTYEIKLDADGQLLLFPVPDAAFSTRGFVADTHPGLDINAAQGTPIVASGAGTVKEAGWHYSYGNYVLIDHGNGRQTLYGHCDELYITGGQSVEAGTVIAAMGSTGQTTGSNCHFEVRLNGERQDPLGYVTLPPELVALPE